MQLLIWGERSEGAGSAESSTWHPFALSHAELEQHFDALEFLPDQFSDTELLLPTAEGAPLPSPRLFREERLTADERQFLGSWRVPTAVFSPLPALTFLTSIPAQLPDGLRLDNSVQFWIEATKLALELLARGRFLPGLSVTEGAYQARWHLVPTDESDRERLRILAKSMPPICRALAAVDAHVALESFMAAAADGLIRASARRLPLSSAIPSKPGSVRIDVGRAWFEALESLDGALHVPVHELVRLDARLKRWNQTISLAQRYTVRSAFRLVPPDTGAASQEWSLDFVLQAVEDVSKELSARDLWRGDLGFLSTSAQGIEELHDLLLKDLWRASHVFEPLHRALSEPFPEGVKLTLEEAYVFLRQASQHIERLECGVILPQWWHAPESRVGLHLSISPGETAHASAGQFLGLDKLVDFSWQISLGDTLVSLEQFRSLVDRQAPLVEVAGTWIELKPAKVRSALEFLERQQRTTRMRLLEALRFGLGVEEELVGLPVIGFDASGWIERLISGRASAARLVEQPKGFTGSLRPYQQEGLSWLKFLADVGIGACLADDMGLGKTIQLLALLVAEREELPVGETLDPTLLVAPMSIIDNWQSEAAKFAPQLRIYVHHGPLRLAGDGFRQHAQNVDLVVTTYSLVARDEALLHSVQWHRIALDEAQNIKNQATKQTKAVRRLSRAQLMSTRTGRLNTRVVLTGTPIENHLEELWSLFDFLNPGYLGSVNEFRKSFAVPIERLRSSEASQRLAEVIKPFVLRRMKTDRSIIDDLPEKIEMDILTTLTPEQAVLYQRVVEEMLPQVDGASGIQRKGLVLATITKLKQICNHPSLLLKDGMCEEGRSGKLSRLCEILEVVLAEGDRVLLFTQYAQMGSLLKDFLQQRFSQEVLFMHGEVPKKGRAELVARFQGPSGPQIFILSLKVGGFGLNLTAANQIIHFDQWWNPAVEEQATDRAFRIGQKRNVQVRKFICRGTLEERIAEMVRHKRELASEIVGSTRNIVAEMSTDELRDLLSLASHSVGEDSVYE